MDNNTISAYAWAICQNLITNWIAYLIGGAMTVALSWWAKKEENFSWPITIVTGLIIATCLTSIYSSGAEWVRSYFVATKTAEQVVHGWLYDAGFSIKKGEPDPDRLFYLRVHTPEGTDVGVMQTKGSPQLISIQSGLSYSNIIKMDSHNWKKLKLNVTKELLSRGMTYSFEDEKKFLRLELSMHYDDKMPWIEFAHKIDFVSGAVALVQVMTALVLLEEEPKTVRTQ